MFPIIYLKSSMSIEAILDNKLEELLHSYPHISGQQPYLSSASNTVLQHAEKELREFKDEYIAIEHLCLRCWHQRTKYASVLKDAGLERLPLIKAIKELSGGSKVTDQNAEAKYKSLERYSKNLNDLPNRERSILLSVVMKRSDACCKYFPDGQKTIRYF